MALPSSRDRRTTAAGGCQMRSGDLACQRMRDTEVGKGDVVQNGQRRCNDDMALQPLRDGKRTVVGSCQRCPRVWRVDEWARERLRGWKWGWFISCISHCLLVSIPEPKSMMGCYSEGLATKGKWGIKHCDGGSIIGWTRGEMTWHVLQCHYWGPR